ncbi:MAG: hypothetical protein EHM20_05025 [Alphaproteobacteria bacterium]|nr:MAG: hypothetical protein EHM20_05025 [Alphaproteobacteria bacterium]
MKRSISLVLFFTIIFTSIPSTSMGNSRIDYLVQEDTTERLENIHILKMSLKELKVELAVLDTALIYARKKPSHKKIYSNSKKVADAITALTVLGGAIASYHFKNKVKVVKIASFIGGLSSSTSVLTSLMADFSTGEAEELKSKIDDLNSIIRATNINLNREIKMLCKSEPSNQMCL